MKFLRAKFALRGLILSILYYAVNCYFIPFYAYWLQHGSCQMLIQMKDLHEIWI